MNTQSLNPNKPSYYGSTGDYDAKIDPSIHNEFATAAYRMGHSLIQGIVKLVIDQLKIGHLLVKFTSTYEPKIKIGFSTQMGN